MREQRQILGMDATTYRFDGISECFDLTTGLISQARRNIQILTPDLEQGFYDQELLVETLSAFLRSHRHALARILIADIKPLIGSRNALIALADRLPSKLKLRVLNPENPNPDQAWVLVDRSGLMFRKDPKTYKGFVNFSDAGQVRQHSQQFQDMWDRATESPEFRRLGI